MSEKEKRIRSITHLHYSKPEIQNAIFEFSRSREVVPRYFEGFGKRPDTLQYPADIFALVKKGATSFHSSEEIWTDPLKLSSEITKEEMDSLRSSWDLLIDIDSPYLDSSKLAAKLIIATLEKYGINNFGIKFSGSKGFHLIVPGEAFPEEYNGMERAKMFPEWPRAISEFLMHEIKPSYNLSMSKWDINFDALEQRTNLKKSDVLEIFCPNCGGTAKKAKLITLECSSCLTKIERPVIGNFRKKVRCINPTCAGFFEFKSESEIYKCEKCSYSSFDKLEVSDKKTVFSRTAKNYMGKQEEVRKEVSAEKIGSLDLVLVAPRHLFRTPYSLHEKTSLVSIVLKKEQIENFDPKQANPMKVEILPFYPTVKKGEGLKLLAAALAWKNLQVEKQEISIKQSFGEFKAEDYETINESIFPKPIKKLLNGLPDGRKRGLFVLITFFRYLGFSPAYVYDKVATWNKKNAVPLKEGYIKSQIDWHFKQKRKIMPPNYNKDSFYKDLKLLDEVPKAKNPVSEVIQRLQKKNSD